MKQNSVKKPKLVCPLCQGAKFQKKNTTYPLRMFDGKQINVGRVSVSECSKCQHLIPTKAGAEKIDRCMATMATVLFKL
jgi:YgiT-type zinc finger domain-containing protein